MNALIVKGRPIEVDQEGYLTDQPDLSQYDQLREEQQEEEDENDKPF